MKAANKRLVMTLALLVSLLVLLGNTNSCSEQPLNTAKQALQAKAAIERAKANLPVVISALKPIEWTETERSQLRDTLDLLRKFEGANKFTDRALFLALRESYSSSYDIIISRAKASLDAHSYYIALELDSDIRKVGGFLGKVYSIGEFDANGDNTWNEHRSLLLDLGSVAVTLAEIAL